MRERERESHTEKQNNRQSERDSEENNSTSDISKTYFEQEIEPLELTVVLFEVIELTITNKSWIRLNIVNWLHP
jgi:hypothetical protein